MKTNFLKLIPMVAFCAIAFGSCSECCSYLSSSGAEVTVCKNDATEYDWAEFTESCNDNFTSCDCD